MKLNFLIFGIAVAMLAGCIKQEIPDKTGVSNFQDLSIPDEFEFKNTNEITAAFTIHDDDKSVIEIYTDNPNAGGELIKKGISDENGAFTCSFILPKNKNQVFISRRSFKGTYETQMLEVNSNELHHAFGVSNHKSTAFVNTLISPGTYPSCNSDCDVSITSSTASPVSMQANKQYCIDAGETYTGNISFASWGTNYLVICGTANIGSISGKGTLIVSSTGTLNYTGSTMNLQYASNFVNYNIASFNNVSNLSMQGGVFENHGTFSIDGIHFGSNQDVLNEGTMNITQNFTSNSSTLSNTGTINIGGNLHFQGGQTTFESYGHVNVIGSLNNVGQLYNYDGTFTVGTDYYQNASGDMLNNCKFIVIGDCDMYGGLENTAYFEVGGELFINNSADLNLAGGSYINTLDLYLGSNLSGPTTSYTLIEVAGETTIWWNLNITGMVDLCDADGIETNHGNLGSDVTLCVASISSNSCNPGNGGTPQVTDTDNDGIPDTLDEYPTDPLRAFNSFYPNASGFASLAFEDLWPGKGDYDFNDFVVDYQYKFVSNAANNIVDVIGKFQVKAVGATLANGFGVSFDINPAHVESVTGTVLNGSLIQQLANGLESGHSNKSVVIIYDNINSFAGAMTNTDPHEPYTNIPLTTISITLNTPQSSVGTEPFNPFLFINQNRGREVHLINKPPTDLADQTLFGQEDDSSNGSTSLYKTNNNFPWVIEVPSTFNYMNEKSDIVTGHLKFSSWAESGGSNYSNWYENQPGYRNGQKIYQ